MTTARFVAVRRPVLALLMFALVCPATAATAQEAVSAAGTFHFWSHGADFTLHAPPFPFPQEWSGVFGASVPMAVPFFDVSNFVMWLYANEAGSVHVSAKTANRTEVPPATVGDPRSRDFDTELNWKKTFTKDSAASRPRFTINVSFLNVVLADNNWPPDPNFYPDRPEASFEMSIFLHRDDPPPGTPEIERTANEFFAFVYLSPLQYHEGCRFMTSSPASRRDIWLCESGLDRGVAYSDLDSPLRIDPRSNMGTGDFAAVIVVSAPYSGTIDLSKLSVGERYTVEYILRAKAVHLAFEGRDSFDFAEASLGDPLDVDSGLVLESTDTPADDQKPVRLCDGDADTLRYQDRGDGTVTDTYTGLMWMRCPAGYTLDESGTSGDMADDRCVRAGEAEWSWQAALQHAASETAAGHADWRLPNVKELDSIVELGCRFPAIEVGPFPDTPASLFWSSTPGRLGDEAMGVGFLDGRILAGKKASLARVRLVRTDPRRPVLPLPALRVGRPAPVVEGDSGGTAMVFPVALDRPASTDVTLHYRTADDLARAGEDYQGVSGTLVIPAGSRTTQVGVPILGDAVGEPDETLLLIIEDVSPNARLALSGNQGVILDDEPVVDVEPGDVYEGDSGSADLAFVVRLSEPSLADTTFDYATLHGTAGDGDYGPAAGTLTIPAGQTFVLVHVDVTGDTAVEGDEHLSLSLANVSANAKLGEATARGFIVEDDLVTMRALNDTGFGRCADGFLFVDCPQTEYPVQDGDVVRPFSFTKLDAAGVPLVNQSDPYTVSPWTCVRDNATGLTWEVKPDDGGLRDRDWTYTWYNSTGRNDGGHPGVANGGVCLDGSNCDTEKFVSAVNAAGLCGHADWRLPDREELRSLQLTQNNNVRYLGDPAYFPEPILTGFGTRPKWTSTPTVDGETAWRVYTVGASKSVKTARSAVRLVRGGN
jgi:hypothetical protein